jgi:YegS/Rv2252/BmrU family lipid kinase
VDETIARLRGGGLALEVARTERAGHGTEIVRDAWARGCRRFLAVGGDGTAHEVVNGVLPADERATLGFVPLGTGNSFLRDFTDEGVVHAVRCIEEGRTQPCDAMRLTHRDGVFYSINLICLGFPADVATVTNRRFKPFGAAGYVLGVLACLASLPRRVFPMQADDGPWERDRVLFHTFSNSKYTGGRMLIAPQADTRDGLVEHVQLGPIGRLAVIRNLPRLFDGTYTSHRAARRRQVRHVRFELDGPVDVMVDGEVRTVHCETLEILPGALDVLA